MTAAIQQMAGAAGEVHRTLSLLSPGFALPRRINQTGRAVAVPRTRSATGTLHTCYSTVHQTQHSCTAVLCVPGVRPPAAASTRRGGPCSTRTRSATGTLHTCYSTVHQTQHSCTAVLCVPGSPSRAAWTRRGGPCSTRTRSATGTLHTCYSTVHQTQHSCYCSTVCARGAALPRRINQTGRAVQVLLDQVSYLVHCTLAIVLYIKHSTVVLQYCVCPGVRRSRAASDQTGRAVQSPNQVGCWYTTHLL